MGHLRAEFSPLTLFAPERIGGMIQALLQDYKEGGWMPKWPNPSYTNIMIDETVRPDYYSVSMDAGNSRIIRTGKEKCNARLDAYFAGNYNWHSNEPSHHVGYLYDIESSARGRSSEDLSLHQLPHDVRDPASMCDYVVLFKRAYSV